MDPHNPRMTQRPEESLGFLGGCACAIASVAVFQIAYSEATSERTVGTEADILGFKLLRFGPRIWMPGLFLLIALALAATAIGSFRQLYIAACRPRASPSERIRATLAAARAAKAEQAAVQTQPADQYPGKKKKRSVRPGRAAAAAAAAAAGRRRPFATGAQAQPWDGGGSDTPDDAPDTPWASEELEVGDDVSSQSQHHLWVSAVFADELMVRAVAGRFVGVLDAYVAMACHSHPSLRTSHGETLSQMIFPSGCGPCYARRSADEDYVVRWNLCSGRHCCAWANSCPCHPAALLSLSCVVGQLSCCLVIARRIVACKDSLEHDTYLSTVDD